MRRQREPEQPTQPAKKAPKESTAREPERKPKKDRKLQEKAATVPHDPVNEQVVIAAAIVNLDERKKLTRQLTPDFFYARGHAEIWSVIQELERKNLVYDPATVQQLSNGDVDTDYLNDLITSRPAVPDNLAHHVEQMLLDRKRIDVAKGPLTELLDLLEEPTTDPDELRRKCQQIGGWFDGSSSHRFLRNSQDVLREAKKNLRERVTRFRTGSGIYPYGIEGLDWYENGQPRLVPGTAPAKSTLIVGESGSGKTTVTNQIVLSQIEEKRVVLHGGWEVHASENLEMFAAFSLGFSRSRLFTGDLTDEEIEAIEAEEERILAGEHPYLKFMDRPFNREPTNAKGFDKRRGNDWNLDVIQEHIEASGADVAIFDLFHKALVETKPDDEKRALDRIQGIADATKAHLILLHHVNKEDMDKSPNRIPTRKAIKGSSAWLDAVDTALATYVPGTVKQVPMDMLEIFVLKQRYGRWPLRVAFKYDADTGLITNGRSVDMQISDEDSLDNSLEAELAGRGKRR
jgi:hypothetical protein